MKDTSLAEGIDLDGVHFSIALSPPDLREQQLLRNALGVLILFPLAAVVVYLLGRHGWIDPSIPEALRWRSLGLLVPTASEALLWATGPALAVMLLGRILLERISPRRTARLALSVGERGLTINGTMLGWDAHSVVLERDIRHHRSSLICHSLGQDQHLRLDWMGLRTEEHTRVAAVIKASWTRHQQRHPGAVPAALTALRAARTE